MCSNDFCASHYLPSAHLCGDEYSPFSNPKESWFEHGVQKEKRAFVRHCGVKKVFVLDASTTVGLLLTLMDEKSKVLGTNLLQMPEFPVMRRQGTPTNLHNIDLDPKQVVLDLFEPGMDVIVFYVACKTC